MSTTRSPGWLRSASEATNSPRRRPDEVQPAWAALRPILVGFLLAADLFTVVALALARPSGWLAPFAAFSIALLGLIGLEIWAVAHRHDDERRRR